MFSGCSTLEQLNAKRRELVQSGQPVATVNAEYNKARKALIDSKPAYRKVVSYTSEPAVQKAYCAYPLREGSVQKNELVVGDGVIYI